MEKRIPEEITNLVYQIPVPLQTPLEHLPIPLKQNSHMRMRQRSPPEQTLQKYLVLLLTLNQTYHCLGIRFLF